MNNFLETNQSGEVVGKDPRKISKEVLEGNYENTSPTEAIRSKCLDCCHTAQEVRYCASVNCALWPFRMGKNPFRTRELSEEQRAASIERLKKAREAKGK